MDSGDHVYSEKEASEIVQRAVRLHEASLESATPYTPGITADELVRIAAEIGVDPKFVEQAMIEGGVAESKKGVLHLTEEFEKVIQGELDPSRFDVILDELKVMNRSQGQGATQVGRTLQATHWTGLSQATVQVTARNGRTRVHVKSNPLFAWLFALHPAFIASVITLGATGESGNIAIGLAVTGVLGIAGWAGFRGLLKNGHKRAGELAERLSQAIAEETASQGLLGSLPQQDKGPSLRVRLNDEG